MGTPFANASGTRLAVLAYIDTVISTGGRSPTLGAIAEHFEKSKGAAQDAVLNLRHHGLVEWTDLQRHGLTITPKGRAMLDASKPSAAPGVRSVGRPRKAVAVAGTEPLPIVIELPEAFAHHRGVKHPPMPAPHPKPEGMSPGQWRFCVQTSNYVLDVGRIQ